MNMTNFYYQFVINYKLQMRGKKALKSNVDLIIRSELCDSENLWVAYLGLVGEHHQMIHKGSGLGTLRIAYLLHLQIPLCAKNNTASVQMK